MLTCDCPVGSALTTIPSSTCPVEFGQIQKMHVQRVYSSGTTKNSFDYADIKLKASWTPLLTAVDGTKVVSTPYVQAPKIEAGEEIKYGGGNETLGGIEMILGAKPSTFTGNLLRVPQATVAALKALACEKVGVYLVNENGYIGALADNPTSPTEIYPIPIQSLFVGDLATGQLEQPSMNAIKFALASNWSDNFVIIKPTDFNALEL